LNSTPINNESRNPGSESVHAVAGSGVSAEAVERAAVDLAPYLRPTPLQFSRAFTAKTRCEVHLKL